MADAAGLALDVADTAVSATADVVDLAFPSGDGDSVESARQKKLARRCSADRGFAAAYPDLCTGDR